MKWPLLGLAGLSCSLTSPALAQGGTVSTGPATTVIEGLIACDRRVRPSAVDPVPFTPFNANIVRFKANRPVSLAVMGVEWEENLGLESEAGRRSPYHPGDAGIVMHIQNTDGGTVAFTDDNWRAQTPITPAQLQTETA